MPLPSVPATSQPESYSRSVQTPQIPVSEMAGSPVHTPVGSSLPVSQPDSSAVPTQTATSIDSRPTATSQPPGTTDQCGLHAPQNYLVDVIPGYTNILVPSFNRTWAIVKNVIGGIIVALDIAGIVMSGCAVGYSAKINEWYAQNILLVCTLTFIIMSLLWQITDFATQQVRGLQKPVHPGAHVAMHLIFVLLMAGAGAGLNLYYPVWMRYTNSYDYERFSTYEYFLKYDTRIMNLGLGCIIVLWLLETAHFVLFIGACVDTHRRREFNKMKAIENMAQHNQLVSLQVPAGYALVPNNMVGLNGTYQTKGP